jgi:hypothetical protein
MILQTIKNYALGILDRLVNPENYDERLVNFYSYFQIGFIQVVCVFLFLLFMNFCGIVSIHYVPFFEYLIVLIPVSGAVEFISRRYKI